MNKEELIIAVFIFSFLGYVAWYISSSVIFTSGIITIGIAGIWQMKIKRKVIK